MPNTENSQNATTSIQKVVYNYNGNPVQFVLNGKLTINATEMAKPFGESKHPKHWLKNQSTNEFIKELSKVRILTLTDLVQVKYGGSNPGTWFHEDVALEFARWLSPAFAIWCNDRIKELLLSDSTEKQIESPIPEPFPEAISLELQVNELVMARKIITRGHLFYSIFGVENQQVHLEPKTAYKVVEALQYLIKDERIKDSNNE